MQQKLLYSTEFCGIVLCLVTQITWDTSFRYVLSGIASLVRIEFLMRLTLGSFNLLLLTAGCILFAICSCICTGLFLVITFIVGVDFWFFFTRKREVHRRRWLLIFLHYKAGGRGLYLYNVFQWVSIIKGGVLRHWKLAYHHWFFWHKMKNSIAFCAKDVYIFVLFFQFFALVSHRLYVFWYFPFLFSLLLF